MTESIIRMPITIETGDALGIEADVLVLKYAQQLYGVDYSVASRLSRFQPDLVPSLPRTGEFLLVQSYGSLGARAILFVGVESLWQFRYQNIREFCRSALDYLAKAMPGAEHVCFTLHGAEYGLDELEAFESEIAGFVDAVSRSRFPQSLQRITIVEIISDRADRLRNALSNLLPQEAILVSRGGALSGVAPSASHRLRAAGYASESKPFTFVAMPFDKKMYDVFHYGIRGPVNNAGFLCERADESYFTGDVIDWVKRRIRQADLVIADLTLANPNVYLEVGYAWGCGKPTILLVQDLDDLKFDVRGHRCLVYNGIRELEELLCRELENLAPQTGEAV